MGTGDGPQPGAGTFVSTLKVSARQKVLLGIAGYVLVGAAIAILMCMLSMESSAWISNDARRFHEMARMILTGLRPYVDYIDPKPPLLFFTVSGMDMVAPGGTLDIPVMTTINVAAACCVWKIGWEDYGFLAGYSAGFLFLVAGVFAEGYFLFSEQFTVLFLLCALLAIRTRGWVAAGIFVGLAAGYKQYALVAIIPILWFMWVTGDRRYHRFLAPVALVLTTMFALLYAFWGTEAASAGLYYTFGVFPEYLTGSVTTFPTYAPDSPLSFAANLLASVAVVLPTLLFAVASLVRRGIRTPFETVLAICMILLLGTLLIRQYLHYWILLLPFLALLACREFADGPDTKKGGTGEHPY